MAWPNDFKFSTTTDDHGYTCKKICTSKSRYLTRGQDIYICYRQKNIDPFQIRKEKNDDDDDDEDDDESDINKRGGKSKRKKHKHKKDDDDNKKKQKSKDKKKRKEKDAKKSKYNCEKLQEKEDYGTCKDKWYICLPKHVPLNLQWDYNSKHSIDTNRCIGFGNTNLKQYWMDNQLCSDPNLIPGNGMIT